MEIGAGSLGEGTPRLKPVERTDSAAMACRAREIGDTMLRPRARKVKILATLGPASSSPEMIRALAEAGVDAFRINMSHGSQAEKAKLVEAIRALEKTLHRPTTIL